MLLPPVDDGVEADKRPSVDLERSGDGVHRDFNVHPALAQLHSGGESGAEGSVLEDVHLAKLEVGLLLQVELVHIPGAASLVLCLSRTAYPGLLEKGLTPSSWGGLP